MMKPLCCLLIVCFAAGVHAQAYKCVGSDGKTFYQDSECSPSTTGTRLNTDPSKKPISSERGAAPTGRNKMAGVDPSCREEYGYASLQCVSSPSGRSAENECLRSRVSMRCMALLEAKKMDNACSKELKEAGEPCFKESSNRADKCVNERLSETCRAQLTVWQRRTETALEFCRQGILELTQLCGNNQGGRNQECYRENEPKYDAACKAKMKELQ